MSGIDIKERRKSKVNINPSVTGSQSQARSGSGIVQQQKSKFLSVSRLKIRKRSYGFSGVPSVGGNLRRRSSMIGMEFKRPPQVYLNTYQLEPRVRFNVSDVTKAVNSILDSFYNETKYNAAESPTKTMLIADEVMRTVKEMNFNRYRIISVVTLGQKRAQSYNNAVAFLWDHMFDSIVDVHREDFTSFIQVTVFGVYLD